MEGIDPEANLSNEDDASLETDSPPSAVSNPQEDDAVLEEPLLPSLDHPGGAGNATSNNNAASAAAAGLATRKNLGRRRKTGKSPPRKHRGVRFHRSKKTGGWGCLLRRLCCFAPNKVVRCMNLTARVVLWSTIIALCVGVFWYSYDLYLNRYVEQEQFR